MLPGNSSPPKSGCSRRVPPPLMKLMKAAELGSPGAPLASRFHQLSGGKRGSGPGRAPPWMGPRPVAADEAASRRIAPRTTATAARVRRGCRALMKGLLPARTGQGRTVLDRAHAGLMPDGERRNRVILHEL